MRLLILGGTEFGGRAVAESALVRGWDVTLLNRGQKPPPAGVTSLRGDRTAPDGLAALDGGEWDVVLDTWSGAPVVVRDSARALAERARRYVYISSRSVYAYPAPAGLDENGPVVADASPDAEEAQFPEAKRGGELAAEQVFGERALLVRPGLILGPHENIGRLPWWLSRIARGGAVLAPGPRDLPLQYIDVRDLAEWTLGAVERGLGGAYNLTGPSGHATMGELLEACVRVVGSDARLRWLAPDAVLAAGLEPWVQLPVWIPRGESYDALYQGNVSKALATGLRCRPVEETVADTWAWLKTLGGLPPGSPAHGLDPQLEAQVLAGMPSA
jgi:2'-hydroxyisoflavone reductase